MNLKRQIRLAAAFCVVAAVVCRADTAVTLTGAQSADFDSAFSSDTTINLSNVTFSARRMRLTSRTGAALTFTINLPGGTTNVFTQPKGDAGTKVPCIEAADNCSIVIAGAGVLELTGEKQLKDSGVLRCNNLTVVGGDTHVTFDNNKDKTSCVYLLGNYRQTGGKFKVEASKKNCTNEFCGVNLATKSTSFTLEGGTFNVEIAGMKSRGINLKSSCTALFRDGKCKAEFEGPEGRFVNGGTLRFEGGAFTFTTNITAKMARDDWPTDISAVKADSSITVTGGDFEADLPLEGSEVFTTDSETGTSVDISGGTFDLVAGNDCIHANGNVTISGGRIRAVSTGDDAIDANGDMIISGGDIRAYATAPGAHALDVNKNKTLTIRGGIVVGTDGVDAIRLGTPGSSEVGKTNFVQTTWYGGQTTAAGFGGKYLILNGVTNGVAFTLKPRLPDFPSGSKFNLLVSVPGRAATVPSVKATTADAYADANSRTPLVFEKKATVDGQSVTSREGDSITLPDYYDLIPASGKTKTVALVLNARATPTISSFVISGSRATLGVSATRVGLRYQLYKAGTPTGTWTAFGTRAEGKVDGVRFGGIGVDVARNFFKVKVLDY